MSKIWKFENNVNLCFNRFTKTEDKTSATCALKHELSPTYNGVLK
jgi:hypothetical protein